MHTAELLERVGLSSDWLDSFIRESNKIDPQPGGAEPGEPLYDWHQDALLYALATAERDSFALPNEIHKLLLRDHPKAGKLRRVKQRIGLNDTLEYARVPFFMWRWNRSTWQRIDELRTDDNSIDTEIKLSGIWDIHCELMNVRPYELYNGKVGRILMVNHSLLVDLEPWVVPYEGREEYVSLVQNHPSAAWVTDLDEENAFLAVRKRDGENAELP